MLTNLKTLVIQDIGEESKAIKNKLLHAEQSGFTTQTKAHMLQEFKRELGLNG